MVGALVILDAVVGDCIPLFSNPPEVTGTNNLESGLLASFLSSFSDPPPPLLIFNLVCSIFTRCLRPYS